LQEIAERLRGDVRTLSGSPAAFRPRISCLLSLLGPGHWLVVTVYAVLSLVFKSEDLTLLSREDDIPRMSKLARI